MNTRLAVFVLMVILVAVARASAQAGRSIEYIIGTVSSCSINEAGATLRLDVDGRTEVFETGVPSSAIADRHIASLVGAVYRLQGACPSPGEAARVTRYRHAGGIVSIAVDVAGSRARLDDLSGRLWVIRQWFDLEAPAPAEREALYLACMVQAHFNTRDQTRGVIWTRDRLNRSWDYLRSGERAADMMSRFGRPDLHGLVDDLVPLYGKYQNAVVIVKGVPFMPQGPGAPAVGWWGTFPIEIHRDEASVASLVYRFKVR